ncbi:hypothetical protein F4777DRAFT_488301 [Nemania sp. FL0916]|nr:hypothetical protein F4777DRAFT_488301 [Nemania sp. FL0916]
MPQDSVPSVVPMSSIRVQHGKHILLDSNHSTVRDPRHLPVHLYKALSFFQVIMRRLFCLDYAYTRFPNVYPYIMRTAKSSRINTSYICISAANIIRPFPSDVLMHLSAGLMCMLIRPRPSLRTVHSTHYPPLCPPYTSQCHGRVRGIMQCLVCFVRASSSITIQDDFRPSLAELYPECNPRVWQIHKLKDLWLNSDNLQYSKYLMALVCCHGWKA